MAQEFQLGSAYLVLSATGFSSVLRAIDRVGSAWKTFGNQAERVQALHDKAAQRIGGIQQRMADRIAAVQSQGAAASAAIQQKAAARVQALQAGAAAASATLQQQVANRIQAVQAASGTASATIRQRADARIAALNAAAAEKERQALSKQGLNAAQIASLSADIQAAVARKNAGKVQQIQAGAAAAQQVVAQKAAQRIQGIQQAAAVAGGAAQNKLAAGIAAANAAGAAQQVIAQKVAQRVQGIQQAAGQAGAAVQNQLAAGLTAAGAAASSAAFTLGAAAIVGVGVAAVVTAKGIYDLAEAAGEYTDASIKLANALTVEAAAAGKSAEQIGQITPDALDRQAAAISGTIGQLDNYAAAIARATNVSKPFVADLEAQAIRLGASADQAAKLAEAAIGLGKIRGRDPASALRALVLAQTGQNEMMLRQILNLRRGGGGGKIPADQLVGQPLLNKALELAMAGIQLAARDAATTWEGATTRIGLAWERLKAKIGEPFKDFGAKFLDGMSAVFETLGDRWGTLWDRLFDDFLRDIYLLQDAIKSLWQFRSPAAIAAEDPRIKALEEGKAARDRERAGGVAGAGLPGGPLTQEKPVPRQAQLLDPLAFYKSLLTAGAAAGPSPLEDIGNRQIDRLDEIINILASKGPAAAGAAVGARTGLILGGYDEATRAIPGSLAGAVAGLMPGLDRAIPAVPIGGGAAAVAGAVAGMGSGGAGPAFGGEQPTGLLDDILQEMRALVGLTRGKGPAPGMGMIAVAGE